MQPQITDVKCDYVPPGQGCRTVTDGTGSNGETVSGRGKPNKLEKICPCVTSYAKIYYTQLHRTQLATLRKTVFQQPKLTAARNYISIACVMSARNYISIACVMPARNLVSAALVTAASNYISVVCVMHGIHHVPTTRTQRDLK
jgi:hypothetical protein